MLLFPLIFLFIFIINTWNDIKSEPSFYVFLLYCIGFTVNIYKIWVIQYEFARLYRIKINPSFPLTRSEYYEFLDKDPKAHVIWNSNKLLMLSFSKHKDKELSKLSRRLRFLIIFAFSSPLIYFLFLMFFLFADQFIKKNYILSGCC